MKLKQRIEKLERILNPRKDFELDIQICFVTAGQDPSSEEVYRYIDGRLVKLENGVRRDAITLSDEDLFCEDFEP
ncbi:MAG: hypothetical protein WCP20_21485 [Desulfuromonadales bacterium]